MFRINLFCDDRKLPELLRALTGLTVGVPDIRPVVNAEAGANGPVAKTNGSLVEKFTLYAKEHKLKQFTSKEARDICKAIGLAPGSSSYVTGQLVGAGVLKRGGANAKRRFYTVR